MMPESRQSGMKVYICFLCGLAFVAVSSFAMASEQHGQVTSGDLPVPGATITAAQGSRNFVTTSDQQGNYSFADLPDGSWKIELKMTGFAAIEQEITVVPNAPGIKWELKMLPLDQMIAQTQANTRIVKAAPAAIAVETTASSAKRPVPANSGAAKPAPEPSQDSSDGFLVNGSVNNAATSQFSLRPAFGNTRKGAKGYYYAGLALYLNNSVFDARPYSLSGQETPKQPFNLVTGQFYVGGSPLSLPGLLRHAPNYFFTYAWIRNSIAGLQTGLVPTEAQLGEAPPMSAALSPQVKAALALLAYYPAPNVSGNLNYNYQRPTIFNSHENATQTSLNQTIGKKDSLYGKFNSHSNRNDGVSLFGFVDTTDTLALDGNVNWSHRRGTGLFVNSGFAFSRSRVQVIPNFAGRTNVEGEAGITGGDLAPRDWGPPALVFSSGISTLYDQQSSFTRNRTDSVLFSVQYYHRQHNISGGGDFRRQEFNYLSQQDPRGTFAFTGAATGVSDFADFLAGIPDTSSIAFGNADKYLRQSVLDAYITDDWRIRPELTINVGLRYEYGAPITELKDRLVNLDVASGFSEVKPVIASSPTGPLTGQHYPNSLLRPDRLGIEPRIGISWRPIAGSSMVIRAGYGVYDDTSVYQATALSLAQQYPLSNSLSVQNSAACPETLANGFNPCPGTTRNTFAVDPNFRVGYAQTWQLAVQRDLPAALQLTATYLGIKGSRGVQEFLPNTYPTGAVNPCPSCQVGYIYRTSGGNSTRESGSLQLRRRLRSGFTATLQYTWSKSIDDDAALGGQGPLAAGSASQSAPNAVIAQDWLNLTGERGLSTFDQRNLLNATIQYASGMGLHGGTLLGGWRGELIKEWTVVGTIVSDSGLPETPVYLAAVGGTGFTGSIRPDRTSASINAGSAPGHYLNPAAFTSPAPGQWGDAGRDSITGPGQFTFNTSLARTIRLDKRRNLEVRFDATNILNHVVFNGYNTTLNPCSNSALVPCNTTLSPALISPLFGLPASANGTRSLTTTLFLRF